jgi:hypothetical protein
MADATCLDYPTDGPRCRPTRAPVSWGLPRRIRSSTTTVLQIVWLQARAAEVTAPHEAKTPRR